ncbi:MAG: exodeoxyribonuclease VII small subunit [Halioglobus sp.]|nr:exodeoxyribonuclease VII small subunit [Halioglobus sp.]
MPRKSKSDDNTDFAAATHRLEELVAKLENEETTLEEAMTAFEEGVKLTKEAQAKLLDAEQKVALLMEQAGEPITAEFSEATEPE